MNATSGMDSRHDRGPLYIDTGLDIGHTSSTLCFSVKGSKVSGSEQEKLHETEFVIEGCQVKNGIEIPTEMTFFENNGQLKVGNFDTQPYTIPIRDIKLGLLDEGGGLHRRNFMDFCRRISNSEKADGTPNPDITPVHILTVLLDHMKDAVYRTLLSRLDWVLSESKETFRDDFKKKRAEKLEEMPEDDRNKLTDADLEELDNRLAFDCIPKNCIFTYPVRYSDTLKEDMVAACKATGWTDIQGVSESTAAGLVACRETLSKYGPSHEGNVFFVADLGGATMDVAVMEVNKGRPGLVCPTNGTSMGGQSINREIEAFVRKTYPMVPGSMFTGLRPVIERTKRHHHLNGGGFHRLWQHEETSLTVPSEVMDEAFTKIVSQLLELFESQRTLANRGPNHQSPRDDKKITDFVFCGGESRNEFLRETLKSAISRASPGIRFHILDSPTVVSRGALLFREAQFSSHGCPGRPIGITFIDDVDRKTGKPSKGMAERKSLMWVIKENSPADVICSFELYRTIYPSTPAALRCMTLDAYQIGRGFEAPEMATAEHYALKFDITPLDDEVLEGLEHIHHFKVVFSDELIEKCQAQYSLEPPGKRPRGKRSRGKRSRGKSQAARKVNIMVDFTITGRGQELELKASHNGEEIRRQVIDAPIWISQFPPQLQNPTPSSPDSSQQISGQKRRLSKITDELEALPGNRRKISVGNDRADTEKQGAKAGESDAASAPTENLAENLLSRPPAEQENEGGQESDLEEDPGIGRGGSVATSRSSSREPIEEGGSTQRPASAPESQERDHAPSLTGTQRDMGVVDLDSVNAAVPDTEDHLRQAYSITTANLSSREPIDEGASTQRPASAQESQRKQPASRPESTQRSLAGFRAIANAGADRYTRNWDAVGFSRTTRAKSHR